MRSYPLLDPHGHAARLWREASRQWSFVLAWVTLIGFFGCAALAPFLSHDRPLWIRDQKGDGHSPLLEAFTPLDWLWLGLPVGIGVLLALRTLPGKRRLAWSWALAGGIGVFLVAVLLGLSREPRHERRRFLAERHERQRLGHFDDVIQGGRGKPTQLLKTGRALATNLGQSQAVLLELYQRLSVLGETPPDFAVLEKLARQNRRELALLRAAIFPANPFSPSQPSASILAAPGEDAHLLGCDGQGRDVLARLIHGSRTALTVALGATLLMAALSLSMGLLGGYFGGTLDWLFSRMAEVVLCLPALVILVALPSWVPLSWRQSPLFLVAFLGLILWPQTARLVRSEVLRWRRKEHVLSALCLGLRHRQVIVRHILPGVVPPLLVSLGLAAGHLILLESSLSFLGLGQDDAPSWGRMLAEARHAALAGGSWHLALFPGAAVVVAMLTFNILSRALEQALNPRQ